MRGDRGPRGNDRAGSIEGKSYTGDPAGVIAPWTGGGIATPAIGQYPTVPVPIDENDDGKATMDRVAATTNGRKSTRDTTKARFQALRILANWLSWFMDIATGTRSLKGVVVDGIGGAPGAGAPGNVSATGSVAAGTFVSAGTDISAGGNLIATGDANVGGTANAQKFAPGVSVVGAAVPTPALAVHALYRGLIPAAWGIYTATGGFLIQGVNIATAVRNFLGSYTFTLINPVATGVSNSVFVLATATGILFASANGNTTGGVTTINVFTYDATGSAADANEVSFMVFGG